MKALRGGPAQPRVLPGDGAMGCCKPQGVVQEGRECTGLRPVLYYDLILTAWGLVTFF